jgi:membrane protein required for colicin V production
MNWLDIVIAIFILISVIGGLMQGIIKMLLSIIGLIVGVVLAGKYSGALADKLTFISDPNIASTVAFVFIVVAVMIIAMILAFILRKVAAAILLGWIDKLGGGVLGLFMGMIFAGALLTMYLKFFGDTTIIANSWLAGFLLDKFPIVLSLLPSQFDSVRKFFN